MKKPTHAARAALTLTLLALSLNTQADWVEIERFDDNTIVYADATTVTREADTAQLLHLVRWGAPQSDPGIPTYLSTVVRTAYDCTDKLEKYLASTAYTGAMGDGAKVIVDDEEARIWYTISAASMEEKLWKLACGVN
ncbi:surface-adhesin E family protein [Propionivibrio limicola]|uniref:surface-adhesin E family protein n=1 Tax=Propionivibrio limicola TaxID=167645 RepID=UPI001290B965|nr:surface-adhesin E family protein [Propionivibrio limicola]